MSSDTFILRVVSVRGAELDLSITCHAGMAVEATTYFAAQVLADLLGEDEILALLPEADPESPWSYASAWLPEHADEIIDGKSVRVSNEVHHPPVELNHHAMRSALRARFAARWSVDPLAVVRDVADEMARLGEALAFAGEPELYTTGSLEDLLEELISAELESAPTPSASLRFTVRDPRWIAHLSPGDEVGSVAAP